MNHFVQLFESVKGNLMFCLQFLGIVAGIIVLAVLVELFLKKKANDKEKILTTRKIAVVGMFSALAGIFFSIEVPIFIIPDVYKFEIGDLPALICGFAFGPVAAVLVECCKILIKLLVRPTSTAFVGELANFIIGCSYCLPATIFYWFKKTKKNAIIGCVIGACTMTIAGALLNGFYLLPTFLTMFLGGNMEALIGMGSKVNPLIKDIPTFVMFAAVPINIIKSAADSVLAIVLYRFLRPLWKPSNNK